MAARAGWSAAEVSRATTAPATPLPRVDFVAEAEAWSDCGEAPIVVKTRTRTVVTLAEGAFEAREVLKRCTTGGSCRTVGSEALARLVPAGQRFGYDLIVHVGLARYLGNRQRAEIRADLAERHGVSISDGSISNLCDRFLQALEALHVHRAPTLRAAMVGGYPMHIDATCDKGKGGLFIVLDGYRDWVLACSRIASENERHLRPVVEQAVALFGEPLSTMHDLGDACTKAVRPLRERGVVDLVCHYHFLGAVGDKLFDRAYLHLGNILRGTKVRTQFRELLRDLRAYSNTDATGRRFGPGAIREELMALVFWILEGEGRKTLRFPFALPDLDFVHRSLEAASRLGEWLPGPPSPPETRAMRCLERILDRIRRDTRIPPTIEELVRERKAFDQLRSVLRLTDAELPGADVSRRRSALSPVGEAERLGAIEREVDKYRDDLRRRVAAEVEPGWAPNPDAIILEYLDRYRPQLFGHPAIRDEAGQVEAIAERTNNPSEHFFGQKKQGLRRRVGRAHLGRDLQQQPAQAAYVHNLRHPEYVRLLCGSIDNLPSAIAALANKAVDGSPLVRDHRDSALIRRARALLEAERSASSTPPRLTATRPGAAAAGSPATVS